MGSLSICEPFCQYKQGSYEIVPMTYEKAPQGKRRYPKYLVTNKKQTRSTSTTDNTTIIGVGAISDLGYSLHDAVDSLKVITQQASMNA